MSTPKRAVVRKEALAGGKGHVLVEYLLGEQELNRKCRMYAKVTLEPGCSIGYHKHEGESETYYLLSGRGEYNDNGSLRVVEPGDVTFTPHGCSHGLENIGQEDLTLMALIILD